MQFVFGIANEARYTNYKGEARVCNFIPLRLFFGKDEHHTDQQWLLVGYDLEKQGIRTYALKDFHTPPVGTTVNNDMRGSHSRKLPTIGDEWGALPDQPCPRCHESGGVVFRNNESEAGRTEHQECTCIKCKYTWIADTPF